RAAVEAMAFQVAEVLETMAADAVAGSPRHPVRGVPAPAELRVDGGASVMHTLLQFQADLAGLPVVRCGTAETTALGAAFLAGLATGVWSSLDEIAATWAESGRFTPGMDGSERARRLSGWRAAVAQARSRGGS
ncbi:MAG TPA: FGGY-family carbohydrate kinase, partial [Candidatus Dormibacteraeota bacterium]|nr:FGGY-family carbohydrate kinase [Candidatus Dormibacteraeota bacterium]